MPSLFAALSFIRLFVHGFSEENVGGPDLGFRPGRAETCCRADRQAPVTSLSTGFGRI